METDKMHVASQPQSRSALDGRIHAGLTYDPLNITAALSLVKSPEAGAIVMFAGMYEVCPSILSEPANFRRMQCQSNVAGTTRNSFQSRRVLDLEYSAYVPRALQSMLDIATSVLETHSLTAVNIVHRLGRVPIGEESILICVSAPHRTPAWRAGEEALERTKDRVEIWKLERFGDGEGKDEAVWRANRDGAPGEWVNGSHDLLPDGH